MGVINEQYRYAELYNARKRPKPKKILLECGCKPQDAIFEIDDGRVEENQSFVLDRVIVDTTCLFRPLVKVEFSSLIAFEAEDEEGDEHEVEVDLLFKLLRTCNGVTECVQTWRYLYEIDVENDIDELEVEISEPFTVTFCDRACPGCCEYKMVVEGKDFEGEFEFLRVTKPELSALAQGECDD
ncbi:MAG TPA: DUF4489 domain-containing protein [Clostridiales bacterium]|jgi:hypothetical protein|nr:DUF4489 domain-containing protein [Clostridiales bacterium]